MLDLVHKLLISVISAAVVQFLALNFRVMVGPATVLWVVIPIIAAYLIVKIIDFPGELGSDISKKVRTELETRFDQINKGILQSTFDDIFNGDKLLDSVAEGKDEKEMIDQLSTDIVKSLS
jgi:hypothetical protein